MKTKMMTMGKRLLALLLCLCLLAGYTPVLFTQTRAADISSQDMIDKTVDPSTIHNWKQYFDIMSTEYIGGVWTDKSVFESFADYLSAEGVTNFVGPNGTAITNDVKQMLATDPANFLIAMSAITANKSISGSSSTPMDTMLVLDVSGSMQGDNAVAVVQATNRAIKTLLDQNVNNRVGVILYSGNHNFGDSQTNTASVLLPLGRYTTTNTMTVAGGTIPAYLTISGSGDNQRVSVASSVNNGNSPDSKNVVGGTYIQNGLYKAWQQFSAVTDTKVPEGTVQAGAQRQPILILMSDGAPTAGTTAYNNVQTSNRGDGGSTSNQIGFLTQLTASWVRGKVHTKYGVAPKFYSLGIGTGNDSVATSVLNPVGSNDTLDGYWNNFFNNTPNSSGDVEIVESVPEQEGHWVSVPRGEPGWPGYWQEGTPAVNGWSVYKDSAVTTQNYIDQYWLANNADGLISSFSQIVEKIVLEAEQYSTLVDISQGADLSGYVTFEDELGELMEVKSIKGIAMGNKIFTGAELAKGMTSGVLGTVDGPTAAGDELVRTVKERMGITETSTAQTLIDNAFNAKQLSYTSATEYSNYIGWYADENGKYVGFWQEKDGYSADNAPKDAKYINKSYGYLGEPLDESGAGSDMMHIVVMVHTEIATGRQSVVYKIPASLLPSVTYHVELNGEDVTNVKSLEREGADPMRLLFEVGLRSGINTVNLKEKVTEYDALDGTHIHANNDGTYTFYTNRWGSGDGNHNVNYDEPLTHLVAQSHFNPSLENERYYHVENDTVYADQNGTAYTGNTAPTGTGYYFARPYYEVDGNTVKYTVKYAPINAEVLRLARQDGNNWIIPEGTAHSLARFALLKEENNPTDTLNYSWNPVILHDNAGYHSYTFLGNNGKFTVAPAQGIALTKTVTEEVAGASDTFRFQITLSQPVANPLVTDADGNPLTGVHSVSGNVITVDIKKDQTVVITGIPTGVTYTVQEVENEDYTPASTNASGTVAAHTINKVNFTNTPKGYGNLVVSKDVTHPFETAPAALTQKQFAITVQLSGSNVANKNFSAAGLANVTSVTTDSDGKFTVWLRDGEFITVSGLPEGTTYTTTEALDAVNDRGFRMDAANSVLRGTIVKNQTAQAHVVNIYEYAPADTTLTVAVTKTVDDSYGVPFDWTNKSFQFKLESYDPVSQSYAQIGNTATVTTNGGSYTFSGLTFDTLGTYYYKVSEVIPDRNDRLEHMSYDATTGRIVVHVTDTDVDGKLEIDVQDFTTGQSLAASNDVITFTKDFVNIYREDYRPGFIEIPVDKDISDSHNTGVTAAGFLFGMYKVEGGVVATNPSYTVRTTGADGKANFHIPYAGPVNATYILKEIIPADADKIPGMDYDETEYTVKISVTYDANGVVTNYQIEKNGQPVNGDPIFTNVMDLSPASAQFAVHKTVEGNPPAEDYTFTLTETDGSFVTPKAGGLSEEIQINGAGNNRFSHITYDAVGTHYYVVKETPGTNPGVTYDGSEYHITVDVTYNGTALVAATRIVKLGVGTVQRIDFTNTYKITGTADVTVHGFKKLDGREMIAGEFAFGLYENGALVESVKNVTNGKFTFSTITYTTPGIHTYTVKEMLPDDLVNGKKDGITYSTEEYTVVVKVTDNGVGGLNVEETISAPNASVDSYDKLIITNTYAAEPVSKDITATKTWHNTDTGAQLTVPADKFSFTLYEADENYNQGDVVATVQNGDNGAVTIPVTYTAIGTHRYVLREDIGDEATVSYDAGRYLIQDVVTDDGKGQLHVLRTVVKDGVGEVSEIAFGNLYTPTSTTVGIAGTKKLENRDIQDDEFTFELYDAAGQLLESVTNTGEGFAFTPITYEKSGTYTYKVVEQIPQKAVNGVYKGVTYDEKEYTVTVTVTDENGALQAAVSHTPAQLVFTNTYTQPTAKLDLNIQKKMEILSGDKAMGVEGYKFNITDEKGKVVTTLTSDKDGKAVYTLNFTDADIGKTFHYEITEVNTGVTGVTYSTAKYRVAITVGETESGALDLAIAVNDKSAKEVKAVFTNTYKAPATHQTGDNANPVFYAFAMAVSLLGFAVLMLIDKKQRHAK